MIFFLKKKFDKQLFCQEISIFIINLDAFLK